MNILPQDMLKILLELLPDNTSLQPEFTVAETVLRARLPGINFDEVIISCIEMGFVDRVRGGYRLNVKADLALRLFAVVHRVVSKPGCTSSLYAGSDG
ncbi:hypothetical protein [Alicyclobacillus fodiniaquatilis]|uniref:YjcQ protein n=1 Tax=Alicyclobacillus fodiniaquatilis TaxID=1661150 RepID=A0ABW4JHT1_9BACL